MSSSSNAVPLFPDTRTAVATVPDGAIVQVAPVHESPVIDPAKVFDGIAKEPFPEAAAKILMAGVEADDVEIKPDGIVYLPEIKYRRVLNHAFGPGGWVLAPLGAIAMNGDTMTREYAMYVLGRFVSCARGEMDYQPANKGMSYATTAEGVKSNALMRCCKDLGIGSELWDPNFIHGWKGAFAVAVWCQHKTSGQKKKLWRRKDRPAFDYPWVEQPTHGGYPGDQAQGLRDAIATVAPVVQDKPKAPPKAVESELEKQIRATFCDPEPAGSELLEPSDGADLGIKVVSCERAKGRDGKELNTVQGKPFWFIVTNEEPKGKKYVTFSATVADLAFSVVADAKFVKIESRNLTKGPCIDKMVLI